MGGRKKEEEGVGVSCNSLQALGPPLSTWENSCLQGAEKPYSQSRAGGGCLKKILTGNFHLVLRRVGLYAAASLMTNPDAFINYFRL